jgi:hypothetical protein
MSTEKRPRIPEDIANLIDERRGDASFEEFVRKALARAVGNHYAEPAPDSPKQMRIMYDGEVRSTGIPPRSVAPLLQDIALVESAADALFELQDNLDAAGNAELAESVEQMAEWLNSEVLQHLYPAAPKGKVS